MGGDLQQTVCGMGSSRRWGIGKPEIHRSRSSLLGGTSSRTRFKDKKRLGE